jgi:hypothetical protein
MDKKEWKLRMYIDYYVLNKIILKTTNLYPGLTICWIGSMDLNILTKLI